MLAPLRKGRGGGANVRTKSFLAPTKGWYSLQNVLAGQQGTATLLVNFFPKPDTVELRGGWKNHSATETSQPVESLFVYNGTVGKFLFAVSGSTIFDVTNNVAVPTSVNTLTAARMQTVNFTTSGGHFLVGVNGADDMVNFDGSAWTTPTITGLSSDTFDYITVFKSRIYCVIKDSLSFAFLPVNSISGAADEFTVGNVCDKGGKLVAMETWTLDGGFGPDDYLVCLTSEGQAAIYKGSDPADSNAWTFVGIFNLPQPVGKRCMLKVGGDIYVITVQGVIPLSRTISLDRAAVNNFSITKNIAPDVNHLAKLYRQNFGWELCSYPKGAMAILNVPLDEFGTQHQCVMNTITGAWCRFTNQNANCWVVFDDDLYFGGNDGVVRQADCAGSDGGSDIIADIRMTDDPYGYPAAIKNWKLIRVNIKSDGASTPRMSLDVDFTNDIPSGEVQTLVADIIKWDEFNWDEANWPAEEVIFNTWQMANCNPGYTAAFRMRVTAAGGGLPMLLQVNGFDAAYEVGGTL